MEKLNWGAAVAALWLLIAMVRLRSRVDAAAGGVDKDGVLRRVVKDGVVNKVKTWLK